MSEGRFAAAIDCMDGRAQLPVIRWLQENRGVEFVDMITEPGPVALLSDETAVEGQRSIRRRLEISVGVHGARTVAVVAHHDCAGNPVGKREQLVQLEQAVDRVISWGLGVEIIGLWVDPDWQVHVHLDGTASPGM